MKPPRIVIDTNVVVSALRSSRGASHLLLSMIDTGSFQACISVPLFLEYEDASKRLIGQGSLRVSDIDDILDYLCKNTEHRQIYYLWRPTLKDPKDDMVLEIAVTAQCDRIVTYNKADFREAKQFGIDVQSPRDFLKDIECCLEYH